MQVGNLECPLHSLCHVLLTFIRSFTACQSPPLPLTILSVYCPLTSPHAGPHTIPIPSSHTQPYTVPSPHLQYPHWPLIYIILTVPQHKHACIHHHASELSKQRCDVMWIRLHQCHKSDDRRAYNSPELRTVSHNAALWEVYGTSMLPMGYGKGLLVYNIL